MSDLITTVFALAIVFGAIALMTDPEITTAARAAVLHFLQTVGR